MAGKLNSSGSLGIANGLSSFETKDGTPYGMRPDAKPEAKALISFGQTGRRAISSNGNQHAAG